MIIITSTYKSKYNITDTTVYKYKTWSIQKHLPELIAKGTGLVCHQLRGVPDTLRQTVTPSGPCMCNREVQGQFLELSKASPLIGGTTET